MHGLIRDTFFAVYRPCDNQWSVLPAFDDDDFFGREKHSLAAVNDNIYILGGLMQTSADDKVTSPDVWKYNIKSKTWSLVCRLPEAVQETSAAVLGHRIYLFGGRNASEVDSDVVQCVDTVNHVAYIAGRLPSPTSMTRAVSNNGLIWVVLKTGQILRMWEDFNLADQIEQILTTNRSRNTNDSPFRKPRTRDLTVSFKEVARIGVRDHFGACIGKGEITVASGEPGDLVWDMNYINLSSGNVQKLPTTYIYDVQCFHLHKINIPYVHLKKRTLSVEISSVSSRSSDTEFVASVLQTSPFWPSHARSSEPEQRGERKSRNQYQGDTTGLPKTFHISLPIQKNFLIPENRSVSSLSSDTESVASVTPISPIPSYLPWNSEPDQGGERPNRSQDHTNIRPNKFYTIMPKQVINTMQSPRWFTYSIGRWNSLRRNCRDEKLKRGSTEFKTKKPQKTDVNRLRDGRYLSRIAFGRRKTRTLTHTHNRTHRLPRPRSEQQSQTLLSRHKTQTREDNTTRKFIGGTQTKTRQLQRTGKKKEKKKENETGMKSKLQSKPTEGEIPPPLLPGKKKKIRKQSSTPPEQTKGPLAWTTATGSSLYSPNRLVIYQLCHPQKTPEKRNLCEDTSHPRKKHTASLVHQRLSVPKLVYLTAGPIPDFQYKGAGLTQGEREPSAIPTPPGPPPLPPSHETTGYAAPASNTRQYQPWLIAYA